MNKTCVPIVMSAVMLGACGGGGGGGSSSSTTPATTAAAATPIITYQSSSGALNPVPQIPSSQAQYSGYGMDYPQGVAAVQYLYSASGTFKAYTGLWYYEDPQGGCNYYSGWTNPGYISLLFNQNELPTGTVDNYVNGSRGTAVNNNTNTIAPDANNHLLYNNGAACDTSLSVNGQSFHEHNGVGVDANGNLITTSPYHQFWFDDNWLARYMSVAYGAPQPTGLWDPTDFTRWKIIGNDSSNWTPYENDSVGPYDQLALDGMYYVSVGQPANALSRWYAMIAMASTAWDSSNQRFSYPNIFEEYHLGLLKILTDHLIASNAYAGTATQNMLIQHVMSMRSDILSDQLVINGAPTGWVSGDPTQTFSRVRNSLVNTETTAIDVLALGADAKYSFEAGQAPLITGAAQGSLQFAVQSANVLSAVVGQSPVGEYMTDGPYMNFPTGNYTIDFYLRSSNPVGTLANISIYDANSSQTLSTYQVTSSDFSAGANQWVRVSVPVSITNGSNSVGFRLQWSGTENLDLATIRMR